MQFSTTFLSLALSPLVSSLLVGSTDYALCMGAGWEVVPFLGVLGAEQCCAMTTARFDRGWEKFLNGKGGPPVPPCGTGFHPHGCPMDGVDGSSTPSASFGNGEVAQLPIRSLGRLSRRSICAV